MHISICTRYQLHAHTYVGISSMSSIHSIVNVFTTQYGEYLHSIHSIDKLAAVSPRRQSQVAETSWKCIMEEKYCHNIVAQNWRKREPEIRVRYSPKVWAENTDNEHTGADWLSRQPERADWQQADRMAACTQELWTWLWYHLLGITPNSNFLFMAKHSFMHSCDGLFNLPSSLFGFQLFLFYLFTIL